MDTFICSALFVSTAAAIAISLVLTVPPVVPWLIPTARILIELPPVHIPILSILHALLVSRKYVIVHIVKAQAVVGSFLTLRQKLRLMSGASASLFYPLMKLLPIPA